MVTKPHGLIACVGAIYESGLSVSSFVQEMYDEKRPEKTKDDFIVSNLSCERIISNFVDWKYTFHNYTSIGAVVCVCMLALSKESCQGVFGFLPRYHKIMNTLSNQDKLKMVFAEFESKKITKWVRNVPGRGGGRGGGVLFYRLSQF